MSAGLCSSSDPRRGSPGRRRREACLAAALAFGALAPWGGCRPRGPSGDMGGPAGQAGLAPGPPDGAGAPDLRTVRPSDLCVTLGSLEALSGGHLSVDQPGVRAVLTERTPQRAELRFRYGGPTLGERALRSGLRRRQIGLKLRAQDGCNVVYVMWRIEPVPGLFVSVKINPGQRAHAECGSGGYRDVPPRRAAAVERPEVGSWHSLRAELEEDELRVLADGAVVWEGALGQGALAFDGPVGLRTDNGRFELELRAAGPPQGAPRLPAPGRGPARCRPPNAESRPTSTELE